MISRSSYPGHITEIVTATAVPPSPRYRRPERCPSSLETYEQSRGDRLGRFARRRSYIFEDLCSIHIRIASRDIDELIDDLIEDGSQHLLLRQMTIALELRAAQHPWAFRAGDQQESDCVDDLITVACDLFGTEVWI